MKKKVESFYGLPSLSLFVSLPGGSSRDVLRHALNGIPGFEAFEGAANFLFVSIGRSAGLTSTELRNRLEPEGILIRDCSNFEGLDDRYFRVAVKRHDQNMVLIEKLKGIIP
jgi:threonine-phosphate decarboxylase